jgi:hypothetical protein
MIVIQSTSIYVIGAKNNGKFSRNEFEQRTPDC